MLLHPASDAGTILGMRSDASFFVFFLQNLPFAEQNTHKVPIFPSSKGVVRKITRLNMFTRFIPYLGLLLCVSYWIVGCIWGGGV